MEIERECEKEGKQRKRKRTGELGGVSSEYGDILEGQETREFLEGRSRVGESWDGKQKQKARKWSWVAKQLFT